MGADFQRDLRGLALIQGSFDTSAIGVSGDSSNEAQVCRGARAYRAFDFGSLRIIWKSPLLRTVFRSCRPRLSLEIPSLTDKAKPSTFCPCITSRRRNLRMAEQRLSLLYQFCLA